MSYEIKPRSLGEILDGAFQLYRNNFGLFLSTTLLFSAPTLLLWAVANWLMLGKFAIEPLVDQQSQNPADMMKGLSAFMLVLPFAFLLQVLLEGVLTVAIADAYLGKTPTLGGSVQKAFASFGTLIGTGLLKGLGIFLGLMLLVIPGVLWMLKWMFSTQAIVLEGSSARPALKRSGALAVGERGRLFLIILILGILAAALSFGIKALIPDSIGNIPFLGSVLRQLPGYVVAPLTPTAITLAYFDARVKKEGFDLQMLANKLGGAPGSPAQSALAQH